jgi:hypothetical protein
VFIPKSVVCLREGYTRRSLARDVIAGIVVGIVALPLALAFAIVSGIPPERGLCTAIIAGFMISALGGSRVQIGGPIHALEQLARKCRSRNDADPLGSTRPTELRTRAREELSTSSPTAQRR